ncbi:MAG: hypothetical protein GYB31_11540 [Bacteroidetes bacterium]|nr:hypothetical protein [Bacteroidota bacterium]
MPKLKNCGGNYCLLPAWVFIVLLVLLAACEFTGEVGVVSDDFALSETENEKLLLLPESRYSLGWPRSGKLLFSNSLGEEQKFTVSPVWEASHPASCWYPMASMGVTTEIYARTEHLFQKLEGNLGTDILMHLGIFPVLQDTLNDRLICADLLQVLIIKTGSNPLDNPLCWTTFLLDDRGFSESGPPAEIPDVDDVGSNAEAPDCLTVVFLDKKNRVREFRDRDGVFWFFNGVEY